MNREGGRTSKRWMIFAIAGTPLLVLGLAVALPIFSKPGGISRDMATVFALKEIRRNLEHYAHDHGGRLPATLHDATAGAVVPLDPSSGQEFVYVGAGHTWDFAEQPIGAVIVHTSNRKLDRHQYALFSTGAVIRISEGDLEQALRRGAPPPAPR